jgi:AraC family transcriptional regulator
VSAELRGVSDTLPAAARLRRPPPQLTDRRLRVGDAEESDAQVLRHCAITREPHLNPKGLPARRLQMVVDFVQANLDGDLSLRRLAALAESSVHAFVRLFKQSTGLAPHQYVLRKRIERAQALLGDPALPLTEIGLRSGFADQSHFSKMFRRSTGRPPQAYRNALR